MSTRRAVPSRRHLWATLALMVIAASASAQDIRYRDGRFLETLGGITIQRSDEASSDEAVRNMPFLPGDRVWTDQAGRAEIVFAEGEILWIAERSKVDSLGRGGRDQDERLGLRVFAGSFAARVREGGPGFEFRAPGGSITSTGPSAFRVDVRSGETVLSVSEGAVLADLGGERLSVRAGDRVIYADGRVEGPIGYQRSRLDKFDRWCEEREEELGRLAQRRDHERLPDELDPYGEELDEHGEWVYDQPTGYVYVPRVAHDWMPYTYGRWVYTLYGWTWVADEPWGFVTSHYGRWGYSSRVGWHWMPKVGFSGAWVGWSSPVGRWSNTIGWCALGFNDRPVGAFAYGSGGRAVLRGGSRSLSSGRGWSYADRSDMGRASIHRRRVDLPAEEAERAIAWKPDAAPDRNFGEGRRGSGSRGAGLAAGVTEAVGAVSRGRGEGGGGADTAARINVRPTAGDSTPELRSDPTTTIPSPESRRQRGFGQDGFKEEQDNRKNRRILDDTLILLDQGPSVSPGESGGRRQGATVDPGAASSDATTRGESAREQPQRDPLLDSFLRSITRKDASSGDSGSQREESGTRRREPSTRREPAARDDSSERRSSPPPRANDSDRQRSRPSGGENSQPRTAPAPRPQGGGSSDERGTSRRPRPGL